jgi:hypothetical protein
MKRVVASVPRLRDRTAGTTGLSADDVRLQRDFIMAG